jgi:hypothetical protein
MDAIHEDLLKGVRTIARFLGQDERAVNHLLATGQLPGGKLGGSWVASKTVLRQHYEMLTNTKRTGIPK